MSAPEPNEPIRCLIARINNRANDGIIDQQSGAFFDNGGYVLGDFTSINIPRLHLYHDTGLTAGDYPYRFRIRWFLFDPLLPLPQPDEDSYFQTFFGTLTVTSDLALPPIPNGGFVWEVGTELANQTLASPSGGTEPYIVAVVEVLPEGTSVALNADGEIEFSGTPVDPQAPTTYTLQVTDADDTVVEETFVIEVLPTSSYLFDQMQNREGEPRTELQRLAQTSLMHIFVDAGALVAQFPSARRSAFPVHRFDESELLQIARVFDHSERRAPNSVRVWWRPRSLDVDVVLWDIAEPIRVPADDSVSFAIVFHDPEQIAHAVAGSDLVVQNVVGNDDADGSGTDRSSDFTVTIEQNGPTWGTVTIANGRDGVVYCTGAEVAGIIYRSYQEQYRESRDETDITATGERRLEHRAPYVLTAAGAEAIAVCLRDIYAGDRAEIRSIPLLIQPENVGLADIQLGDRVEVEIGDYDENCGVESVDWEFPEDGIPRMTLGVSVTSAVR